MRTQPNPKLTIVPSPKLADPVTPIASLAATVSGHQLDLRSLEGVPTVLWFWTPWCRKCQSEAPVVAGAHTRFKDTVQFIGLAGRDESSAVNEFIDSFDLYGFDHVFDSDGSVWSGFKITEPASFILIDDSGEAATYDGGAGLTELMIRIGQIKS